MSVALAASLQFIRAEGFVFSHVADEGLIATASAGDLLRYRDSSCSRLRYNILRVSIRGCFVKTSNPIQPLK